MLVFAASASTAQIEAGLVHFQSRPQTNITSQMKDRTRMTVVGAGTSVSAGAVFSPTLGDYVVMLVTGDGFCFNSDERNTQVRLRGKGSLVCV